MAHETILRILLLGIVASGLGISIFYRRRADQAGGQISRLRDGRLLPTLQKLWALPMLGSLLAFWIQPSWMAWSQLSLPPWLRWLGAALALATLPTFVWLFRHLGNNITPTASARLEARLVTSGPYRYIRHPLYTFGSLWWLGMGLMMTSWLVPLCAVGAFLAMAWRTPQEEALLLERFGEEYRSYMDRTGRYWPRLSTLAST